jgi:hypothetical protein
VALPPKADATNKQQDPQAAGGRRVGICVTTFSDAALRLLDNGYLPIPILPGAKRPAVPRWSTLPIDVPTLERWTEQYPACGIGLRCGSLVGIDIDILDPDLAHRVDALVRQRLGDTLTRVGRWPKRLLPYRTDAPLPKITGGTREGEKVEVLGLGQQFVAFGIHPDTGRPYHWVEDTPLDVPLDALPCVTRDQLLALAVEIEALLPSASAPGRRSPRRAGTADAAAGPVRDEGGLVVDGRDGYLSTIAFHAVHDAIAAGNMRPDAADLAETVWRRFEASAEPERPASHGARFSIADAERKVADKLRLLADGRLPPRLAPTVEADYQAPVLPVAEARERLEDALQAACDRFEAWHAAPETPAPLIGIKATVGLGKSTAARRHLLAMRERLIAAGLPSKLLILVPSHVLADEVAAAWRSSGEVTVAVLRGYGVIDPETRVPMCGDLVAVQAAIDAGVGVHKSACSSKGRRCALFHGCLKQRNRIEVAKADVVVAPHAALFSGFRVGAAIAAIVIDEGHWSSVIRDEQAIGLGGLALELLNHSLGRNSDDALADLHDLRCRAAQVFGELGPVPRSRLLDAGLDEQACRLAAGLEARRLRDPGLYPGMPAAERKAAAAVIAVNARTYLLIEIWHALAKLGARVLEHDGGLFVRQAGNGAREVIVTGLRPIHATLANKPILHLDATLRPALAASVLPGIEVEEIDAAMPNMALRLVVGSFGKGALCPARGRDPSEAQRRANRLTEVVDYVRWQARRVAPGRVLVVSYKDCEPAFAAIPGVDTGHFNAIAGLDAYRDVRLLVVVGRPLPSDLALAPLSGALFRHLPEGGYTSELRGVRMRDGSSRAVRVRTHADERAELLRAAICDDEVLQAIGRGRGVNRTPDAPLEVHVLADVALPLVHDQIVVWDMVRPDLMQRMLLAGIAVASPGDAALLHPALFANAEQAKKAMQRGFGGQNPIRDLYREMSPKSAAYRRPGRGCSRQRAWWIDGDADAARSAIEAALGALAEWQPDT